MRERGVRVERNFGRMGIGGQREMLGEKREMRNKWLRSKGKNLRAERGK